MENNLEIKKTEAEKEAREFSKSPWVFLVRKSKLTYLIIAFLLLFGLMTIKNIPRELQPEVEIPYGIVVTPYPGASPLDVEEQITKKIENQISDIEGIKRLTSTSSLGSSSIVVEFEADLDVEDSIRKLKDEVDSVKSELPDDAFDPSVIQLSFSDEPILVAALSSDKYDVSDLKKFGENLQDKLKSVPYISDVRVIGGRSRVIKIDLDKDLMSEKGISVSQVLAVLAANNINFPLGSIEVGKYRYSLRVEGKFKTAGEVAMMPIGYFQDVPIYLSDIAKVKDGFSKESSRSRLSIAGAAPTEAVSIQVYKKTGGDITKVAEETKQLIENSRGVDYPEDVEVEVTMDLAKFIRDSINTLSANGLETVLIILVLLFMFLGWREALLAGLAVPFSFFIAFIVMSISGESLNFLSLFSLVLALGLLVDSAIVIVEGMYQKVSTLAISGYQAALLTIKEYSAPLLSGMLTTVAAFVPLLFVKGIIGQFMKVIPIVVIATLTAALFVALTIIPSIGALIFKPRKKIEAERMQQEEDKMHHEKNWFLKICKFIRLHCHAKPRSERLASKIFAKISGKYCQTIPKIIGNKKNRIKLIATVVILFFISITLPFTGLLKIKSFAETDGDFFYINIKMPNGTVLEETDRVSKMAEEIIRREPEVTNFVTNVGTGLGMASFITEENNQTNRVSFQVNLTDKKEREETSFEIVSKMRQQFENEITQGEVTFVEQESGPPSGSAVELRVAGEDLEILQTVAEQIKDELAQIPTVIDAKTSVEFSSGEFVFYPNKEILTKENLSVIQVAQEARKGVARDSELEISQEGEEIKLDFGFDENQTKSVSDIQSITITAPTGKKLALSELGKIQLNPSLASINRQEKERVVTVTAGTEGGNPTEITQQLKEKINDIEIPSGYRVIFGGESQELMEVYQDMLLKMIIGIILILFILIIQFNSYRQVAIILFTIPLAITGVFFGMTFARLTIDIPSFIGIVSLAGIVVNNAIILIDQMNKELERRNDLVLAVQQAGNTRFRPIILTSITTIFGLLPLSITQPDWRNMGFTIIFGLTFSAFLTLFVVPTLFVSFYRKRLEK